MQNRSLSFAYLVGFVAVIVAAPSRADIQYFRADLDSSKEGTGGTCTDTGSPATGTAWFALDTVANTVNYSVVFSGLVAPESGAHVHGSATPCNSAGVLFALPAGNPKIGSYVVSAGQKTDMQNGMHYINIHSDTHTGGEIRGQILPVAATQACFKTSLDPAQEGPGGGTCTSTGETSNGLGNFDLDMATRVVSYRMLFVGLSSAETAAHVHGAALPCFNASPIITLPAGTPKTGTYSLTVAQTIDMLSGLHYVNVHTSNHGSGEIRGQLLGSLNCVPAVSTWGIAAMALLTLSAGSVVALRNRSRSPA